MQNSYLILNNSHMRKKQQRKSLRTHGRNTNVITISFYLSDLKIKNVHSQNKHKKKYPRVPLNFVPFLSQQHIDMNKKLIKNKKKV